MCFAENEKPPRPFNRHLRPSPVHFLVFGEDRSQNRLSILRFNEQLQKGHLVTDMEKREYASYSAVGEESIFMIGGQTAEEDYATSVSEFLVREGRWCERAPLAFGRWEHAAAVLKADGRKALLGVFGGHDEEGCLSSW
ncbi:unnamed protein product [Dibothriocephalus latus]|uniref:Uncharacterized protein n=1 Tax=Dibothriocephalus latus TaxID=60516 RepID=A0A3P7KWQ0_DIBLA|nr:unnamed protein product [Dibothriocephalus latus]